MYNTHNSLTLYFVCHPRSPPGHVLFCRADLGSIAVATETGADVTLVAGRLAGALIITVMKMQPDGTSSVALRGGGLSVDGWKGRRGWHQANSPHPPAYVHPHTCTCKHTRSAWPHVPWRDCKCTASNQTRLEFDVYALTRQQKVLSNIQDVFFFRVCLTLFLFLGVFLFYSGLSADKWLFGG